MKRDPRELGFFEADLALLGPDQGGRKRAIRTGYRPNWWLPAEDGRVYASASIELLGAEELVPGETGKIRIFPFAPEVWEHVDTGAALEMCEGPYVLGNATVTRVVPAMAPAGRS
jgi:hypothetical protein